MCGQDRQDDGGSGPGRREPTEEEHGPQRALPGTRLGKGRELQSPLLMLQGQTFGGMGAREDSAGCILAGRGESRRIWESGWGESLCQRWEAGRPK